MSGSAVEKSKRNLQPKYKPEALLGNANKSVCENTKHVMIVRAVGEYKAEV